MPKVTRSSARASRNSCIKARAYHAVVGLTSAATLALVVAFLKTRDLGTVLNMIQVMVMFLAMVAVICSIVISLCFLRTADEPTDSLSEG